MKENRFSYGYTSIFAWYSTKRSKLPRSLRAGKAKKGEHWRLYIEELTPKKIVANLKTFEAMKHILRVLINEKGLKEAFPAKCSSKTLDTNCGCCDGCWSRFAHQAVIYVKCTSGLGGVNVCLPMGAIFSSEP
jgi:hypothetical protein